MCIDDFGICETLRANKYGPLSALAYSADIKGLLTKKVFENMQMRHPFSTYLIDEFLSFISKISKKKHDKMKGDGKVLGVLSEVNIKKATSGSHYNLLTKH